MKNLVKIVGDIIDLREELKEMAREVEYKAKKLDRNIDDLMEFLKHRGLIETRRVKSSEKPSPPGMTP